MRGKIYHINEDATLTALSVQPYASEDPARSSGYCARRPSISIDVLRQDAALARFLSIFRLGSWNNPSSL